MRWYGMRVFENYTIEENIQYINKQLDNGVSMLKIEKEHYGVKRDTITKKLNRRGYKRDSDGNKLFILADKNKTLKKPVKQKKAKDHNRNNSNSGNNNSSNTKVMISKEEYNNLLELIELKEDIKQLLYNCNNNNSNSINVIAAKDVSLRQMKIDNEVYNKFREFCNEHKQYKYQDLVSTALMEFVNKYSNR